MTHPDSFVGINAYAYVVKLLDECSPYLEVMRELQDDKTEEEKLKNLINNIREVIRV